MNAPVWCLVSDKSAAVVMVVGSEATAGTGVTTPPTRVPVTAAVLTTEAGKTSAATATVMVIAGAAVSATIGALNVQVTVWTGACTHDQVSAPVPPVALTKVSDAGNVSVTVTGAWTSEGPRSVTVSV